MLIEVRLIINLIKSNSTGVYNVGTETKTMFELASKTKEVKKTFHQLISQKILQ